MSRLWSFNYRFVVPGLLVLLLQAVQPGPTFAKEDELALGILAGRQIDRDVYLNLIDQFNQRYPDYETSLVVADDRGYKEEIHNWLTTGRVDVAYGQVGNRLCLLAASGSIAALDDLWNHNQWDKDFSPRFKGSMSCNGDIYGVPIAYYYWGFFYKKSVFEAAQVRPPKTWQEFHQVAKALKQKGFIPITFGSKNHWPAGAWFSYLNLRLNGLAFHLESVKGRVAFHDPRIREVFVHLKQLVDGGYFLRDHRQLAWTGGLPYLYRDLAGMMLTGSFLTNILPDSVRDDIGFFRFPIVNDQQAVYEEVPTDVMMLNQVSRNSRSANDFLTFIAQPETQAWISTHLGYFPPNRNTKPTEDRFSQIGVQHLKDVAGFSQFFDRDAHHVLAVQAPPIFADFLDNPDIDHTLEQLERIRLSIETKK